jgi:hypothetical protein
MSRKEHFPKPHEPMGAAPRRYLPDEEIPRVPRGEIARTLAATAALVVALNAAAGWVLTHHSPNRGFRVLAAKWQVLDRLREPVDLLVLGDSSGNQAVVPSVLQAELGMRSVNLAMIGNVLALGDAWMLEAYMQKFGPPRAVLLVHVWDGWSRGTERLLPVLMKIPKPWGFWARVTPPLSFTPRELWKLVLARYVPLYSENTSMAQLLKEPLRPQREPFMLDPDGYMPVHTPDPAYVERDRKRHQKNLKGRVYRMSDLNRTALAHLKAVAEAHGITVYLADAPLHEGLYRHPAFHAYYQAMRKELKEYADSSPLIHYIPSVPLLFPSEEMTNTDHLAHAASLKYTRALAREIQALGTPGGSAPPLGAGPLSPMAAPPGRVNSLPVSSRARQ